MAARARVRPSRARRARVTNHVALPEGGYAQRLEIAVAPAITLDAVLLLPEAWGDDAPGVLVTVDEGGKAAALDGPAAAVARELGWAVLAPDLRGTGESAASEFELATAAWVLDRDLLADRVHDLRSCVRMLSERYSTGQQIDKRRLVVHGDGPFALVALLAAALDDDIAGAVATGFVASLEELLVESPRITPMVFGFGALETYDVRRSGAARAALRVGRRFAGRPAARGGVGVTDGAVVREVADRVFACEQPDGPRIIRQVVIGGEHAALVVDTGLPGSPG